MGRLEELRINAYLSEVARGYSNNAFVAQYLFPTIYSEKEKIDIHRAEIALARALARLKATNSK